MKRSDLVISSKPATSAELTSIFGADGALWVLDGQSKATCYSIRAEAGFDGLSQSLPEIARLLKGRPRILAKLVPDESLSLGAGIDFSESFCASIPSAEIRWSTTVDKATELTELVVACRRREA